VPIAPLRRGLEGVPGPVVLLEEVLGLVEEMSKPKVALTLRLDAGELLDDGSS